MATTIPPTMQNAIPPKMETWVNTDWPTPPSFTKRHRPRTSYEKLMRKPTFFAKRNSQSNEASALRLGFQSKSNRGEGDGLQHDYQHVSKADTNEVSKEIPVSKLKDSLNKPVSSNKTKPKVNKSTNKPESKLNDSIKISKCKLKISSTPVTACQLQNKKESVSPHGHPNNIHGEFSLIDPHPSKKPHVVSKKLRLGQRPFLFQRTTQSDCEPSYVESQLAPDVESVERLKYKNTDFQRDKDCKVKKGHNNAEETDTKTDTRHGDASSDPGKPKRMINNADIVYESADINTLKSRSEPDTLESNKMRPLHLHDFEQTNASTETLQKLKENELGGSQNDVKTFKNTQWGLNNMIKTLDTRRTKSEDTQDCTHKVKRQDSYVSTYTTPLASVNLSPPSRASSKLRYFPSPDCSRPVSSFGESTYKDLDVASEKGLRTNPLGTSSVTDIDDDDTCYSVRRNISSVLSNARSENKGDKSAGDSISRCSTITPKSHRKLENITLAGANKQNKVTSSKLLNVPGRAAPVIETENLINNNTDTSVELKPPIHHLHGFKECSKTLKSKETTGNKSNVRVISHKDKTKTGYCERSKAPKRNTSSRNSTDQKDETSSEFIYYVKKETQANTTSKHENTFCEKQEKLHETKSEQNCCVKSCHKLPVTHMSSHTILDQFNKLNPSPRTLLHLSTTNPKSNYAGHFDSYRTATNTPNCCTKSQNSTSNKNDAGQDPTDQNTSDSHQHSRMNEEKLVKPNIETNAAPVLDSMNHKGIENSHSGATVSVTSTNSSDLPRRSASSSTVRLKPESIPGEQKSRDFDNLESAIPNISQLQSTKSNVSQLQSTKSNIFQLESTKSNISQLESTKPNISQLESTKPNISQLESTKPNISQLEPTKPNISQLESTKPNISQLKSTNPNISQPKSTKANISQIEPTKPNISQLEPTKPNISQLEPTKPNISQPKSTKPNISQRHGDACGKTLLYYVDMKDGLMKNVNMQERQVEIFKMNSMKRFENQGIPHNVPFTGFSLGPHKLCKLIGVTKSSLTSDQVYQILYSNKTNSCSPRHELPELPQCNSSQTSSENTGIRSNTPTESMEDDTDSEHERDNGADGELEVAKTLSSKRQKRKFKKKKTRFKVPYLIKKCSERLHRSKRESMKLEANKTRVDASSVTNKEINSDSVGTIVYEWVPKQVDVDDAGEGVIMLQRKPVLKSISSNNHVEKLSTPIIRKINPSWFRNNIIRRNKRAAANIKMSRRLSLSSSCPRIDITYHEDALPSAHNCDVHKRTSVPQSRHSISQIRNSYSSLSTWQSTPGYTRTYTANSAISAENGIETALPHTGEIQKCDEIYDCTPVWMDSAMSVCPTPTKIYASNTDGVEAFDLVESVSYNPIERRQITVQMPSSFDHSFSDYKTPSGKFSRESSTLFDCDKTGCSITSLERSCCSINASAKSNHDNGFKSSEVSVPHSSTNIECMPRHTKLNLGDTESSYENPLHLFSLECDPPPQPPSSPISETLKSYLEYPGSEVEFPLQYTSYCGLTDSSTVTTDSDSDYNDQYLLQQTISTTLEPVQSQYDRMSLLNSKLFSSRQQIFNQELMTYDTKTSYCADNLSQEQITRKTLRRNRRTLRQRIALQSEFAYDTQDTRLELQSPRSPEPKGMNCTNITSTFTNSGQRQDNSDDDFRVKSNKYPNIPGQNYRRLKTPRKQTPRPLGEARNANDKDKSDGNNERPWWVPALNCRRRQQGQSILSREQLWGAGDQ